MHLELAWVAERLALEFTDLPCTVVIDAVCSCAGECDDAGPFFIEQAARARLTSCREAGPSVPLQLGPATAADARCALPVAPQPPGTGDVSGMTNA
ncbi:MAG: hypothetical protein ACXV1K_07415 [Kineosporiaceae bacterium]